MKNITDPKIRVFNIEYDIDEECGEVSLPSEIIFYEDEIMNAGTIADAISDNTGFCVNSYDFEEI